VIHRDGRVRSNPDGSIDHWTGDGWTQAVPPAEPNPFPRMEVVPMIWNREPVLFFAVVQAAVTLVTAFGVSLSAEQVAAINLFSLAVLSLIVRHKVTPA
jgi:hypothetical protein